MTGPESQSVWSSPDTEDGGEVVPCPFWGGTCLWSVPSFPDLSVRRRSDRSKGVGPGIGSGGPGTTRGVSGRQGGSQEIPLFGPWSSPPPTRRHPSVSTSRVN